MDLRFDPSGTMALRTGSDLGRLTAQAFAAQGATAICGRSAGIDLLPQEIEIALKEALGATKRTVIGVVDEGLGERLLPRPRTTALPSRPPRPPRRLNFLRANASVSQAIRGPRTHARPGAGIASGRRAGQISWGDYS
jgi:hypothetical protein